MVILAHSEGELGVFGVAGVVMDNYALEVVILAHSEGELGVFGVAGVVMDNNALEVVISAHSEGELGVFGAVFRSPFYPIMNGIQGVFIWL